MSYGRFPDDEIDRRGREWYEQHLRDKVEAAANIGKQIVSTLRRANMKLTTAALKRACGCFRISQTRRSTARELETNAVYSIGETLTRSVGR
jgi:hypothetical protein